MCKRCNGSVTNLGGQATGEEIPMAQKDAVEGNNTNTNPGSDARFNWTDNCRARSSNDWKTLVFDFRLATLTVVSSEHCLLQTSAPRWMVERKHPHFVPSHEQQRLPANTTPKSVLQRMEVVPMHERSLAACSTNIRIIKAAQGKIKNRMSQAEHLHHTRLRPGSGLQLLAARSFCAL